METNPVKDAYKNLYPLSKGMEKCVVSTLEEYIPYAASRKKDKERIDIVLCGEKFPLLKSLKLGRNFSSALISSGWDIPVELIDAVKTQKSFSMIGIQKYLFMPQLEMAMSACGFETLNLGALRDDMTSCEPLLRNVNYVFLDLNSIKHADYPWNGNTNPNGFYSNEICQIGRYIGFSCNLKAVFIYGIPQKKCPEVCANMAAQTAWHIADAAAVNIKEDPASEKKKGKLSSQFEHRIVDFMSGGDTLTFINSSVTGRWWMEIPVVKKNTSELVACSLSDYHTATESQVPIRWLFYYNKFNSL